MINYQTEVASTIAICTFSSTLLLLRSTRNGKIALKTDQPLTLDGLDSEIFLDGTPVDEARFWKKMTLRKLLLTLIFLFIFSSQLAALIWYIASNTSHGTALLSQVLIALSSFAILATSSVTKFAHYPLINHLSFVTTSCVFFISLAILVPGPSSKTSQNENLAQTSITLLTWYLPLLLYCISCIVAMTTPRGPALHFPPEKIYSNKTIENISEFPLHNVSNEIGCSILEYLMFSYVTPVFMLGRSVDPIDLAKLPILAAALRASVNLARLKAFLYLPTFLDRWHFQPGSGVVLAWKVLRANWAKFWWLQLAAAVTSTVFYGPIALLRKFLIYLEMDPQRQDWAWGWVYAIGILLSQYLLIIVNSQLWSLATNALRVRLRVQLNTILFSKTLLRKDINSSSTLENGGEDDSIINDFSSKAQIMNLMTTDVSRIAEISRHCFTLTDSSIGIAIGLYLLYKLLGVSCFIGLLVVILSLPINHFAGSYFVGAQEKIMQARDERVALTNEVLGAIRTIKFMAWERKFEQRILSIRDRELKHQKYSFKMATLWETFGNSIPLVFAVVSFWHFAVIRKEELTPSIAFTAIVCFTELQYTVNQLPQFFVDGLQAFVSLQRVEKYLAVSEVPSVPLQDVRDIEVHSASFTWPQMDLSKDVPNGASTPKSSFSLADISLQFPSEELSLVCGKTGSGKTLLLLSLLGETDMVSGQMICPRSPPDLTSRPAHSDSDYWLAPGTCAYVPQIPWLRNETIRENILFNLPYDPKRYQATLEACALILDLQSLEDGDESEIGEQGVNLSGGQKARVSLARAVYSRASILLIDDVLSAVDSHTAHHIYHRCIRGELLRGRTVVLISHHVQLCGPQARYVVALNAGHVEFSGDWDSFKATAVMHKIIYTQDSHSGINESTSTLGLHDMDPAQMSNAEAEGPKDKTFFSTDVLAHKKIESNENTPRKKYIEDETHATGHIQRDVWTTYIKSCGSVKYWVVLLATLLLAALSPLVANTWLKIWSATEESSRRAVFYISVYAGIVTIQMLLTTVRWFILYSGSIQASKVLYKRLLEAVLFANIRFHDTVSRGRLLNRFGKDFEGIDSTLPGESGRTLMIAITLVITFSTITVIGGPFFLVVAIVLGYLAYQIVEVFAQVARDLRRLSSVTSSPLFSIYGEVISGLPVIRAFGASSTFMKDMIKCTDTNMNLYYWSTGLHRWLAVRVQLASGGLIGLAAILSLLSPRIDASMAGLAMTFASTLTLDIYWFMRRFVDAQQAMIGMERVNEYFDLPREAQEIVEPRPPFTWPSQGSIRCENLIVRYAPGLPDVLHNLSFQIKAGEKIGILGRTGSGKSTLGLSLFRFLEAAEGKIFIDGLDISKLGLTDLRRNLTIIPQDPVILSGTLRSTLDVFDEYTDSEIFEALRRVQLIPSIPTQISTTDDPMIVGNVFCNLESPVSELGENLSTGERQLLCMARAILRRSRILLMDEATASVDFATDEIISKAMRHEFADSTILTIAHRLRTVIDYDRVMVLEQGRLVEFDRPALLLGNKSSRFYSFCEAAGADEFAVLRAMAAVSSAKGVEEIAE